MKRSCLVIVALCASSLLSAQSVSKNNYTGSWDDAVSWSVGSPPPTNIDNLDVTINGLIFRDGAINLKKNNSSHSFVVNDTLVVRGSVLIEQNGPKLVIKPNAVCIVIGNFSSLNNIVIDNGGVLIVNGDMSFHNGQSETYDDNGGKLYVSGSVTNNADASGHNTWNDLDDDYPALHDYIACGGYAHCILPVKLAHFDVKADEGEVDLTWTTTSENNFREFVIQRSADGFSFEDIGTVAGKGFDIYNIETSYSFTDVMPLRGVNYYRLKAVDLDDSFEFFQVKKADVQVGRTIHVYPNPSSGEQVSFHLNFTPAELDRVTVTDPLGEEIFGAGVATVANEIVFQKKLTPGVYLLRYRSKNFEEVKRIVVKN